MADAELTALRTRLGGRYHVDQLLGRGGMGAVYLARELRLDRAVALKVLPASVADDPVLRDRFLRETRLAASFSHPNIVPVYAVEEQDDLLAFAMGFVEGESLSERVARSGPLTGRETVRLLQDVGYALAHAHARGIVHRDIKPDNIMVERASGRALVMDFGIARRTSAAPQGAEGLTRIGEVVGTPEYMSPEQATGDAIDGRSDLYSLGLVAWFAVTGQAAMSGGSTQQVLVRQLTEALPSLSTARPDLPPALASVVARCVAKDPSARFADAAAMVDALEQAQLSAPEIPVPVRLLANELGLIGMILLFTLVIGWLVIVNLSRAGLDDIDQQIPIVIFSTVLLARFGQVLGEARQLARLGFDADSVQAALRSIVDEAEGLRAAARADAVRISAQRQQVRIGGLMLVIGAASIAFAYTQRRLIAPGFYHTGPLGIALLFNGLACLCVALVLWLRSPLRMPVGEWLFRAVWLGAPGRMLLRWSMRSPDRGGRSAPGAVVTPVDQRAGPSGANRSGTPTTVEPRGSDGRLASLESRVRALEAWRDGTT